MAAHSAFPRFPLRLRATLRHFVRHPLQLILSIIGVSLGVAITVSLDLAIQSSREAFRISGETITGRATHRVVGGVGGLPDDLPARLRIEGELREVAPVVEGWGVHPDFPERPLRILGVDPFSEAPFRPWLALAGEGTQIVGLQGATFLSAPTAEALGVEQGDPIPLRVGGGRAQLFVQGILEPEDPLARQGLRDLLIVDLAEAQELLGALGRLDRIDLRLPSEGGAALQARLEGLLPPDARIEAAGARDQAMLGMTRAFDLNLRALSLLGLMFGVFLIYNTMTFAVVQRRRLFGTLRALGTTRGQLLRGVLGEALALGVAGSALGLVVGVFLGRGLTRLITRTINDLYFVVSVEGLAVPPELLVRGLLMGIVATVVAAFLPSLEATSVSPREALQRSNVESRVRTLVPRAGLGGVVLLSGGALLLVLSERSLGAAFGGLFLVLTGLAFLVPVCTLFLLALIRPVARRVGGIVAAMAVRGVATSLSRTAPALAALVIAVSVTVGLGIMIDSFRGSVVRWLDVTLEADLYISPPSVISSRPEGQMDLALVDAIGSIPGVQGLSTYRGVQLSTPELGIFRMVALGLDPRGERALDLLEGGDATGGVFLRFRAGEGVLVSEPFAFRHRVGVGDSIRVPSAQGEVGLQVLGVFRDYGSEAGVVMIGRVAYDALFEDPAITSLGLFLLPGVDVEAVANEVRAVALRLSEGDPVPLEIRSNLALRTLTLEVFDRTFEVTRVLRLLAFIVAFIAVFSALMALQFERGREFGVLRANGMTPGQGWVLVTTQTGVMGLLAGVLALPVGVTLAAVMIHVVNRRSFGWTLDMEVGAGLLLQAVLLAFLGALLAGVLPARSLSRTPPSEALRSE
jgi:putative ABC transport system permease protein